MATFSTDSVDLHYEIRGDGDPVVLLHGFTSLGSSWERHGWVEPLSIHGFRPILMDARSHGLSSRVFDSAACTTRVLALDVVRLLDYLQLPSVSVIGFSMGGGIALELAFQSPSRVRRLVIGGVGDAAINELHDPAEVAAIAEAFSEPSADPIEGTSAAVIRRNAEAAGNDLRALLPFLQNGGWPAGLGSVAPLTMPTLVIVAEADEYMSETDVLLSAIRPTQVLRLHGKGHHQVMGDDEVKQETIGFLRSPRV